MAMWASSMEALHCKARVGRGAAHRWDVDASRRTLAPFSGILEQAADYHMCWRAVCKATRRLSRKHVLVCAWSACVCQQLLR